ncbi:hypothetical protein Cgig2_013590 [Carnegiea gigantea]|uniref:Uncharacterized protein n=1 Tax=Carnegiea gigantea TaxID=171969 RepID=A0A9Q1QF09_9CARY|nr:hypothetical protein Cgig2_013590 [Carnegiea gigantea]
MPTSDHEPSQRLAPSQSARPQEETREITRPEVRERDPARQQDRPSPHDHGGLAPADLPYLPHSTPPISDALLGWHSRRERLGRDRRLVPCFLRTEQEGARTDARDKKCSTEIVAMIASRGTTNPSRSWPKPVEGIEDAALKERRPEHTVQPILVGDMVLHWTDAIATANEHGKLTAHWEGLYKVTEQVRLDTYRLSTSAGQRNSPHLVQ